MTQNSRTSAYPILPLILNRWSPRAMSGEPLSDAELLPLFEAARWAPSSFNGQPWRFLYGKRDTVHWNKFFDLLGDFNKEWCKNAAVLGISIAKKTYERNQKPNPSHAYDTGASWENLFLEGFSRGLVVHGMSGFDYEKAKATFSISDDYIILAMFAIGKKGAKESLSQELQGKEFPSDRKKLEEIAFEGDFRG